MARLGEVGWINRQGQLITKALDAGDAEHRTLLELFASHCPDCRRALDATAAPLTAEPPPLGLDAHRLDWIESARPIGRVDAEE